MAHHDGGRLMTKVSLNKLDAYRMADPAFRVHARLFRIQGSIMESALANLRATRASSVGLAGATTSIFIAIIAMLPNKALYIVPFGIVIVGILVWNIVDTIRKTRNFDKLIKDIGGEEVEKWIDYTTSVIAAYTTRIRMIDDALEELESFRESAAIDHKKYLRDKKYCEKVRNYSTGRLSHFNAQNEELFKSGKRSKEDYDKINDYLEYYLEIK